MTFVSSYIHTFKMFKTKNYKCVIIIIIVLLKNVIVHIELLFSYSYYLHTISPNLTRQMDIRIHVCLSVPSIPKYVTYLVLLSTKLMNFNAMIVLWSSLGADPITHILLQTSKYVLLNLQYRHKASNIFRIFLITPQYTSVPWPAGNRIM